MYGMTTTTRSTAPRREGIRLTSRQRRPRSTLKRSARPSRSPSRKKPWQKILYERQPYPDDYVDETFLDSLIQNRTY